ncbi:unnamed protein product [Dibothriocephalus latus]|uniref:Uncharacterized protein n=1 Tax=Dibothriocephalus latus TaxID=60516 RepID=A0A3P7LQB1_DIBLA|nr:unnamed protein product [Dibothriocephalus latus]
MCSQKTQKNIFLRFLGSFFHAFANRLIHLGQQNGDRRKWIHLFETVNAIFFFASLTDFIESGSTAQFKSKMDESLDFFLFLLNSVCLSKKDIIIFFTKMDLLPEVFEKTSVQSVYENYEGIYTANVGKPL